LLEIQQKESQCTFTFNFSEVFWNSRLQNEHVRQIATIPSGSVVCDMFCGIGPFVVPMARRGCIVYGNDLNPACYKYLLINADQNLKSVGSVANQEQPTPPDSALQRQETQKLTIFQYGWTRICKEGSWRAIARRN